MLSKDEPLRTGAPWLHVVVLVAAVAALIWFRGSEGADAGRDGATLHRLLRPSSGALLEPGELDRLVLEIPPESAAVLQATRDRGLERGVIVQTPADTVPAEVLFGGERMAAEVRIKGDWPDHVASDKWSLRIELDEGYVLGARVFSIQAPHTVGGLWEWLVLRTMRRENVLAPRATFVDVVINGNPAGVYFLQEHFRKELLESQGRREGPIVIWDESTFWNALLQDDLALPLPRAAGPAAAVDTAPVRAYGEKKLSSIDSLARGLDAAVEKMRALRSMAVAERGLPGRLRTMQALADLRGRSVDELLETDRLSCAHALASLFQLSHPLGWHNMRFHHDPLADRLEPIAFDNMAHEMGGAEPVPLRGGGLVTAFAKSDAYYNGVFRYLGLYTDPAWLDELFAELGPELDRYEAHVDPGAVAAMHERLVAQARRLRDTVLPDDPVNFAATYELDPESDARLRGTIEVTAWATTRAPVVVEGFRFRNGSFSPALACLAEASSGSTVAAGAGVVLARDGRPARFRFPMDERLANLESVQQIKRAIKDQGRNDGALDLAIQAVFRPLATEAGREEALVFRRFDPAWRATGGRPSAPTLDQALALHPFLEFDPGAGELLLRKGTFQVAGDLVLPAGLTLRARGPTALSFEEGAVFLAHGPLVFAGTEKRPIVLQPSEGAASFAGVFVLEAGGRSEWSYVAVTRAAGIARGGWSSTGGVTFYRSPVTMRDCRITGSPAEDGLNVVASDLLLERVELAECASDAFDGDFVTGEIRACVFRDGGGDGVDLSGADARVVDCSFQRLGDKALSVGEASRVTVAGGEVRDVLLGVVSKDLSEVRVEGISIRGARSYALAAYVKKPAFGPSSLIATGVEIEGAVRGEALAQNGCVVEWNGARAPTQALDVELLYQEGILGR